VQQLAALGISEPIRHGPAQDLARPWQHLVLAVLGLEEEQCLQGCAHPIPNGSFGPVLEATGIDHAQELPAQPGLAALRKEEGQHLARKSPLQEAAQAGPHPGGVDDHVTGPPLLDQRAQLSVEQGMVRTRPQAATHHAVGGGFQQGVRESLQVHFDQGQGGFVAARVCQARVCVRSPPDCAQPSVGRCQLAAKMSETIFASGYRVDFKFVDVYPIRT
jgi:hypothetical protein